MSRPHSSPRVAIGPAEVAGCASALQAGLRRNGATAEVAYWRPLPGPFQSDRALGRVRRAVFGATAPLRFDVLHFQQGVTWLPFAADALAARAVRRTTVVTYFGDDCRLADVARRLGWPMAHLKDPSADAGVRAQLARMGRVCDAAVVADLELASYVRPHFERVYVTPVPLHGRAGSPASSSDATRIRVVHSPSDERVKGTAIVRAAAASLGDRVELAVVSGATHDAVLAELARADVAVDQLFSVSASVFALEAMRAGLPVVTHLDRRGLAPFHAQLPAVHATRETLAHELESLADDPQRRSELGEAGRRYVATTHAAAVAGRAALRIYDHCRSSPAGLYEATADGVRPLTTDVV